MKNIFLDINTFVIDEKVTFFEFSKNSYQVFNDNAEKVAHINQKITVWEQILRVLIDKKRLPFLLEIKDSENTLQAVISRGWTFGMSNIKILDKNNTEMGTIKRKFSLKPTFMISDFQGNAIAQIIGDYYAWDFEIKDLSGKIIGTINKKWTGFAKELFSSADKYIVKIDPNYSDKVGRILILSSAITIDMILKNNK
ncbi:MAG: scramblase [Bacteroidia bacterium]|nr:scramblase [Bacteroidia bacterium]